MDSTNPIRRIREYFGIDKPNHSYIDIKTWRKTYIMNARTLRFIAESYGSNSHEEILSTLDVDELLRAVENDHTQYLEGKTVAILQREIRDSLRQHLTEDQTDPLLQKLADYRLVDEVYQLHRGKHVRWISRTEGGTLTKGGSVLNVRFSDLGTLVLVRNGTWFTNYRFDQCITFQKLSDDELLVLAAYNAVSTLTGSTV